VAQPRALTAALLPESVMHLASILRALFVQNSSALRPEILLINATNFAKLQSPAL